MKKTALLFLIGMVCFGGCMAGPKELSVGYVPGPFFHYGQSALSQDRRFDLGDILPNEDIITAVVPFTNRGLEPLVIENVEGLSGGLAGWEGERRIGAKQKGTITLMFAKDDCTAGPAVCSVVVQTNDPANRRVRFFFDCTILEQ